MQNDTGSTASDAYQSAVSYPSTQNKSPPSSQQPMKQSFGDDFDTGFDDLDEAKEGDHDDQDEFMPASQHQEGFDDFNPTFDSPAASKSNTAAPPAPTKPASKPLQKPVTTAPNAKVFSANSAASVPTPAANPGSLKRGRAEDEEEVDAAIPRPSQRARSKENLGDEEVTALNASAKNKRKRDDEEEVGGEATGEDIRGSLPKRQTVTPAAARASVRLVAAQFAAAGPAPAAPEKIKIPPPPRGFTKAQWLKIHTDLINAEHARRAGVNGSVPAAGSAPRPAPPQADRSINADRAAWFVAENARQHSRRRSGSGEFWAKGGDWGVVGCRLRARHGARAPPLTGGEDQRSPLA